MIAGSRWVTALFAVAFGGLSSLVGCKRPFDESASIARGRAAVEPFQKELGATLTSAMAKGPESAVDVCAVDAPAIAARSGKNGVRMGRASSRLRNSMNAPPTWVGPLLSELEAKNAPAGTARAVLLPNDRVGYVSAITVGPLCVTCHGASVDPALEARLAQRYPSDRAMGYAIGDFRGVFWAELPPEL